MTKTCKAEGCAKQAIYATKGLCKTHYNRLRKRGTLANWSPKPELDRFAERVAIDPTGGCWTWLGTTNRAEGGGYGVMSTIGRLNVYAHRWSYERFVAPIPDGLQIDHLCRNTLCVNPSHLEPVTPRENVLRGESPFAKKARQDKCKRGHPFDAVNTYWRPGPRGGRDCRECRRRIDRERKPRRTKETTR